MAKRYIPKPGDRFKVEEIVKVKRPTKYERNKLYKKAEYRTRPLKNESIYMCYNICWGYICAVDEDGNMREFRTGKFYFIKKTRKTVRKNK